MPPTAPVTHRSGKGFGQYGSTTKRGTSLSAALAGWWRGAQTIATPKMLASTALPVRVKIFSDGGRIWSVIQRPPDLELMLSRMNAVPRRSCADWVLQTSFERRRHFAATVHVVAGMDGPERYCDSLP